MPNFPTYTDVCVVQPAWDNKEAVRLRKEAELAGTELSAADLEAALSEASLADQWLHVLRIRILEVAEDKQAVRIEASVNFHHGHEHRDGFGFKQYVDGDDVAEDGFSISGWVSPDFYRRVQTRKASAIVNVHQDDLVSRLGVVVRTQMPTLVISYADYQACLELAGEIDPAGINDGNVLFRELANHAAASPNVNCAIFNIENTSMDGGPRYRAVKACERAPEVVHSYPGSRPARQSARTCRTTAALPPIPKPEETPSATPTRRRRIVRGK